ncbi:MAG: nuclear transport factor 2 family protein [Flavisolibacter sp.]
MKRMFLPVVSVLLLTACNNSAKVASTTDSTGSATSQPDTAKSKMDVSALMDAVHNGLHKNDLAAIENSMAPDALILGTDPKEIWPFSQFKDTLKKFFADTSFHGMVYNVPAHEIRVNGTSAVIIDQYQLNDLSKKVMTRNIAHARYENGKWVLDLMSWNLVPKNEDVRKIDKAL